MIDILHKARLYKSLLDDKSKEGKVKCLACMQECIIPLNHTGLCGVRQNKEGKLYLLVYGKASAVNLDPIEKKPLFHFLPKSKIFSIGTVGCNFGCEFCQNWDLSQVTRDLRLKLLKEKKPELSEIEVNKFGYDLPPKKVVELAKKYNAPSIAYTYNEPTIFFEYAYDTAKLAHSIGIKNVFVSNGYESEEALIKIKPYLDAINIDLKSFDDKFYQKLCKAKLQPILNNIKKVYELGIWLEITTLLIPNQNDSDNELTKIAEFIASIDSNIPWHVTAFHPEYKMEDILETKHSDLIRAYNIGKKAGLKYVYIGNINDSQRSNTYCPKCNELLISRNGYNTKIVGLEKGKCNKCHEKISGVWE